MVCVNIMVGENTVSKLPLALLVFWKTSVYKQTGFELRHSVLKIWTLKWGCGIIYHSFLHDFALSNWKVEWRCVCVCVFQYIHGYVLNVRFQTRIW